VPRTERIVREFLSRQRHMYIGGPVEPVAQMLAPDVVWHVPGANAIAGDHRGRDAVLAYFARRRELAGTTLRITEHAHVTFDDTYVAIADGTAVLAGESRTWRTAGAYRVADGRIAEAWLVPTDLAAFDAAWREPG
jgi:ketosteroid isomerase-like protein